MVRAAIKVVNRMNHSLALGLPATPGRLAYNRPAVFNVVRERRRGAGVRTGRAMNLQADGAGDSGAGWQAHPLRGRILGEVHARPFRLVTSPRAFLHYAFETPPPAAAADRAFLEGLCLRHGAEGPGPDRKVHHVELSGGTLRWEQFTEFTSYTFDTALPDGAPAFAPLADDPFGADFRPPGPVMVATRIDIVTDRTMAADPRGALAGLQEAYVSASLVVQKSALILTDFRVDRDGRTRILVVDRNLNPHQAGALVQRLLEIETYRTFAMLGLPEAQSQAPVIGSIEKRLVEITAETRRTAGLDQNRRLLADLTSLTAELEAAAAASAYRFGASRAYDQIVGLRLAAIDEEPYEGYPTFAGFLARRTAPAMRTLQTLQERQQDLSAKLARAANLLRTRVDVELEQQNRDVLESMNRRVRLQLRLQQTVEGLSVAAISYYVVGLIGYLAKGSSLFGVHVDPATVTAVAVIPAIAFVWWTVRRIRKKHSREEERP
jgi:uncharacterized membrane-anchored protein